MKKKLPKFKSEKEEAQFWSKYSPLDFEEEFTDVKEPLEFDPALIERMAKERREKKRSVTFRIEPSKIDLVKIIAKKYGSAYQATLRIWINEKIYEELKKHPEIKKEIKKYEIAHRHKE